MKILLVDDHQLFREGIALLLSRLSDNLTVVQAGSCEEALELVRDMPMDLLLLDIGLPGISGLEGIVLFREQYPDLPIVALSGAQDEATVRASIEAGAMGFIPKTSSSELLIGALRLVLAKGIYLPASVFLASSDRFAGGRRPSATTPADLGLTARQTDVLYLVLQGKPVKSICRELDLAESTVKSHISAVLRALNVTTRTQAIVAAGRMNLRLGNPTVQGVC